MDLVDVEVLWSDKGLPLAFLVFLPHQSAWLALEMKNHRELGRTILGNEMAILLVHGVPAGSFRISNVHADRTILGQSSGIKRTCILRLVGEATPKNARKIVWRGAMKVTHRV
jgi:hypothetical protein